MKQYKICVYAICKNEEQFVDRWMDAVSEADLVVVCDTGSTDQTIEKLRTRGAVVHEAKISPWRFDTARNLAMDYIPQDVDICVSNDLDEVFEQGWREKLEAAWDPAYTRVRYRFAWSHKPDGSVEKEFPMEKIHRRHGFRWVHPVHEVLEFEGEEKVLAIDDLLLHHYPDLSKPRAQYLPLLELSAAENPQDDRTIFWLGREYMYHRNYGFAIQTLLRHLSLPSAVWNEERSASMRYIGECYKGLGNKQEALPWLYRALAECPDVREPYLALAKFGYEEGDWPLCYVMAEKGLCITEQSGSYLSQPESWGPALYDYGAIAACELGLLEKAREYAERALALDPDDPRLGDNLALISQKIQDADRR